MSAFKRFQNEYAPAVRMRVKLADTIKPVDEKKVQEILFNMWKGDEKLCRD